MSPWDVIGWLIVAIMALFTGLLVYASLVAIVKRIVRGPRTTASKRRHLYPVK